MKTKRIVHIQCRVRPEVKHHFQVKYKNQASKMINDYLEKIMKRDKKKEVDNE